MELKPHQVKYAKGYKDKALLAHETGSGKTVCACVWLKDGRDIDALVVCPKRVLNKWRVELRKWGTEGTVVSKEQFKKTPIRQWSAIILDEADEFASPLFTKGRSQLSESMYNLIRAYPNMPVLLLSATPVRSNPWNLHTLLCFIGIYIDWKKFREVFFVLEYRPFMNRPAYFPVSDWRKRIRVLLEKHADIVLLRDCVDELPPFEEVITLVKSEKYSNNDILQPKEAFVDEHRHEQKNKLKTILEIAKGYRKVLVVAYYVEQIKELEKQLSKDRLTYAIHGGTKDQEKLLKEANSKYTDECFLIVQASIGCGFDADTFSCVIFTSMSYSVRDLVQMRGRVRRTHNLHPVIYHYLMGGRCDKAVYKNVQLGKDFVPSTWNKYGTP